MIEIFSPDTLRRSIESASSGNATVLYDDYGNPNFMSVIPRKTLGDLYPTAWITAHGGSVGDIHPAFIVQDTTGGGTTEVSQIFISQYHNTIQNNCGVSMPNQIPYHGDRTDFETYTNNKGYGWHIMNSLEYGLLWGLAMNNDVNVKGNTHGAYSDTTERFNFSGDEASKSNLFEIETDTLSCITDMTVGEIVTFNTGGQGVLINTYRTLPGLANVDSSGYMIMVQADVGHHLGDAASFEGELSGETGSIIQVKMHETVGTGPISWTHNHSPWGVWMFGAGREFIDSCMLTPTDIWNDLVLKCVRNNYREQGDRDLEVLTTNISAHVLKLAQLGYQAVGPAGAPIVDALNNVGLITGGSSYYAGGESPIWYTSGNSSNCDDADMLLMKEMGLYPVCPMDPSGIGDFRTVWLPKENIRWNDGYFITMYTDALGRMYLCRGGWQCDFTQSDGTEKTMHSFSFTANSGVYDRKCLRFRTVYIPEI